MLREITLLRMLQHEYVVKIMDVILEPNNPDTFDVLYVVFEYEESDLRKLIKSDAFLKNE
jgi:mitogen-activated protein kinase 1/3